MQYHRYVSPDSYRIADQESEAILIVCFGSFVLDEKSIVFGCVLVTHLILYDSLDTLIIALGEHQSIGFGYFVVTHTIRAHDWFPFERRNYGSSSYPIGGYFFPDFSDDGNRFSAKYKNSTVGVITGKKYPSIHINCVVHRVPTRYPIRYSVESGLIGVGYCQRVYLFPDV